MSITARPRLAVRVAWALACSSAALSILLLDAAGPVAFRIGVACMAGIAATCMAVGDYLTGLLRNAHTGPFAAGAIFQLPIGASVTHRPTDLIGIAVIAVVVNTGLYAAMGLCGWVGFGDVKFVTGLTLIAALLIGAAAMLLPVLAIVIAAGARVVRAGRGQYPQPHGPALVIALALILAGAW